MNYARQLCASVLLLIASPAPTARADGTPAAPASNRALHPACDFPIVYVRVARPYPAEYAGINHLNQAGLHQTNAPGAELRILHPDGRDESLVPVAPEESITDPVVSFDGEWVYFAKFHHMGPGPAHMSKLRSREGADIYKIHVATRKTVRLTHQERSPSAAALAAKDSDSHPRGVHNLAPCPVPGGRLVFVSDRNGIRGVREQTQPALQLFAMDDDGANLDFIGPMNLGTALHPVVLKDGRVMFSSLETQGLRSDERWGIWAIRPDGTHWEPLTSALGSPPGQAVHFQAQLSDQSIVVESYYQTGSTDGFGTYWKFPLAAYEDQPAFVSAANRFAPLGITELTTFASFQDIRPNHPDKFSNREVRGNVTHPAAAPENRLLTSWAPPHDQQDQRWPVYDAGIYLAPTDRPLGDPGEMVEIKNDPDYQELWPRALVPYRRIYGVSTPARVERRDEDASSPHLPQGTPFGLVGSASLTKRESFPNGVVPDGEVTARSQHADDRKRLWRELSVSRFGFPGNWGEQGAEAGLYRNSDIWGVRILITEPVSDAVFREDNHFALGSNAEERLRILGEFPVRKFDHGDQPADPDGHPDTSFLAKIPADTAWTFQTIDHQGMAVNMAQTWHQLRPGEIRNDCGGCHAHSQKPTEFGLTAAAKPDYQIWDLTETPPLLTSRARDRSGKQWDRNKKTGVRYASAGVTNVEFYRDIKPILDRSCVACHTTEATSPGRSLMSEHHLALDDYTPIDRDWRVPWAENVKLPARKGLPHTYARLAQYSWAFQARRSPLIWKIYGRRLDGFANEDIASPELDYHDPQDVLDWCHHGKMRERDVDFRGTPMPQPDALVGQFETQDGTRIHVPALTAEEKLTLVRWVDLGCPIDLPDDDDAPAPNAAERGWLLDEGRPTLTLTLPAPGRPLSRILVGMHDYFTGLDPESFSVTADFPIDGVPAGEDLARRFRALPGHRWEWILADPVQSLAEGTITVEVGDRAGNLSRVVRRINVQGR